jgi:hypothetical protein
MVISTDFKALKNLLGGYFYQYWEEDYEWNDQQPNCADIIYFYKTMNPPNTISQAVQEMHTFLSSERSESEIAEFLDQIGVGYYPPDAGQTYQEWLQEILFILENRQDKPNLLQQKKYSVWTDWEEYAE